MLSNAALPPATSPVGARSGAVSDLLRSFTQLFEHTQPAVRADASSLWWLFAFALMGAFVRLWGLGAVGLHGDEETMAMAVRHILVDGTSVLPSGMLYPRGLTQLYLMALSVSAFGETEWALRLPSVVCGVALIPLSYVVGRRFLRSRWSLALAATVAFLPSLIILSQTARMYIFMITFIAASMACLFAWERTDRNAWLVGAVAALIFGLDMQALTVAAAPLLLLPGLLGGNLRRITFGAVALCVVLVSFVLIDGWTSAQYPVPPPEFAADLGANPVKAGSDVPRVFSPALVIGLWVGGVALGLFALHVARTVSNRVASVCVALLLVAGIGLQFALYYHLAGLAFIAATVLAFRFRTSALAPRLIILATALALLGVVHAIVLAPGAGSFVRLVGAMIGQPSVWPYVRIAELSPVAGLLTAALVAWGLYALATRRPVADYWLLALIGVCAPVFALGLFAWNVPPRYTTMSLIPMLLCAFAFAQRGADWFQVRRSNVRGGVREILMAATVTVCVVNPVSAASVFDAGYQIHPDHKGAAEFIRSQGVSEDDVLLAEDVLQQTYYLGKVDYWLIGPQVARRFIKREGDGVVDFYTGTPVIATPAMLDAVLQENAGKRIFLIGSGEGWRSGRRGVRGDELGAAIESDRFEIIYTGRDGHTHVKRAVPSEAGPSIATEAEARHDEAALAEEASRAEDRAGERNGSAPPPPHQPATQLE